MTGRFGLYVILTDPVAGYTACAEAAVAEGVGLVQLRMKNRPPEEILRTAEAIRSITRGTRTLFIVNDDVRIAAAAGADGVHLGQNDMDIDEARRVWGEPGRIYGLSTHSRPQAEAAAAARPDYIGVGPVFKTPTKAVPDPVLGLKEMGAIIAAVDLPAVAIGGINESNLFAVLARGAVNFAAVRPVMQSADPRAVIGRYMRIWKDYCEKNL
ncbi:thiamine phosphate synthase [bacterium]|nr:thiamine phosphate synthase [bacterium]